MSTLAVTRRWRRLPSAALVLAATAAWALALQVGAAGPVFADPIPTAGEAALSDFYSAVPAAAELDGVAAAGVGAAADVEITGVCVATFPACAAGALGIGGVLLAAKFGPSVIKWAFGGSHPAPGALSTQTLAGIGVSVVPDDSNVGGYGPHWDAQYSASGNAPNGYAWTHFTNMKVYTTFVESGDGSVYGGISTSNSTGLVHEPDVGSTSTRATIHNSCYWLSAANGSSYMVGYSGDVSSGAIHSYCNGSIAGMGDRGPGAGSVTVTGHCYNAATGAADGIVAGTSSWSGSDTTIPDTALPGCPSGDGLGGIDITGTGSASGADVETSPDRTKYGAPFGTGTGPITVDNPWLPSECEAQNADCYTTWQHAVGEKWVDVDADEVPVDHGHGYRCELKTGAGAQVSTMPDSACEAPGSTDTDTSPDQGEPVDGDPQGCFPHGWGLMNPVDWVLDPVECSYRWAFEPRTSVLETDIQNVKDAFNGSALGTVNTGIGDLWGAVTGVFSGSGNCHGPQLPAVPQVGLTNPSYPLDACNPPLSTWAAFSRGLLTFLVLLGGGYVALNVIAKSFGWHLPWQRIAPWWEGAEQQALF